MLRKRGGRIGLRSECSRKERSGVKSGVYAESAQMQDIGRVARHVEDLITIEGINDEERYMYIHASLGCAYWVFNIPCTVALAERHQERLAFRSESRGGIEIRLTLSSSLSLIKLAATIPLLSFFLFFLLSSPAPPPTPCL